jgi:hypothetical protein
VAVEYNCSTGCFGRGLNLSKKTQPKEVAQPLAKLGGGGGRPTCPQGRKQAPNLPRHLPDPFPNLGGAAHFWLFLDKLKIDRGATPRLYSGQVHHEHRWRMHLGSFWSFILQNHYEV